MRDNVRLPYAYSPTRVPSFGTATTFEVPKPERRDAIYAFATTTEGGNPAMFRYEDDQDGVEALSNLIRSETVIAVVKGLEVTINCESVVSIKVGSNKVEDRMSLLDCEE